MVDSLDRFPGGVPKARVPEEAIERLEREVSLVELVKACGIALTGSGDNLMGLCPLHADQTLSRVVSPSKNVWHPLGACQAGVTAPVRLRTDRRT